jgi:hypothetical protein
MAVHILKSRKDVGSAISFEPQEMDNSQGFTSTGELLSPEHMPCLAPNCPIGLFRFMLILLVNRFCKGVRDFPEIIGTYERDMVTHKRWQRPIMTLRHAKIIHRFVTRRGDAAQGCRMRSSSPDYMLQGFAPKIFVQCFPLPNDTHYNLEINKSYLWTIL